MLAVTPTITEVGIIFFVVMTILKYVFEFVTKMKNGSNKSDKTGEMITLLSKISTTLDSMLDAEKSDAVLHQKLFFLVKELHTMHDEKGEDGVPVWYFRKEIGDLIKQIDETTENILKKVS